jgi:neutral ceramidase
MRTSLPVFRGEKHTHQAPIAERKELRMIVGTSQVDITPQPGVELAGFAVRPQPSIGILDNLAVRGLYLEDGPERLLWLHADLIALERPFVEAVRQFAEHELGIPAARVLLSATHTHSGPVTVIGNCLGKIDPQYYAQLGERFRQAARSAMTNREECSLHTIESRVELGVDRRRYASKHTDPRLGAVGWRRGDGSFKAVLLSYSMHPVCLCESRISADWPGAAARILSQALPGQPTALVSSGACGNIDPPRVGVAPDQMCDWGARIAQSALTKLREAATSVLPANGSLLCVASEIVPLPLEEWTLSRIHEYVDRCLADPRGRRDFQDHFAPAVEAWRKTMIERFNRNESPFAEAELFGVAVGDALFLAVNAEIFSRFTDLVRQGGNPAIYTVGCANGMIGYVPAAAAYDEGDYEVEWSMLFYNRPRPRRGGLELLAENARRLVAGLTRKKPAAAPHA